MILNPGPKKLWWSFGEQKFYCANCNPPELPFTCALQPTTNGLKFDLDSMVTFKGSGNFEDIVYTEEEDFNKTMYYLNKVGTAYSIPCVGENCTEQLPYKEF